MSAERNSSTLLGPLAGSLAGAILLVVMLVSIRSAVKAAGERLATPETDKPAVAIADEAEAAYCTPQFKQVLERKQALSSVGYSYL